MENNLNFVDYFIGGGMGIVSIALAEIIMQNYYYYPSFSVKFFSGLIMAVIGIFIKARRMNNDN